MAAGKSKSSPLCPAAPIVPPYLYIYTTVTTQLAKLVPHIFLFRLPLLTFSYHPKISSGVRFQGELLKSGSIAGNNFWRNACKPFGRVKKYACVHMWRLKIPK